MGYGESNMESSRDSAGLIHSLGENWVIPPQGAQEFLLLVRNSTNAFTHCPLAEEIKNIHSPILGLTTFGALGVSLLGRVSWNIFF